MKSLLILVCLAGTSMLVSSQIEEKKSTEEECVCKPYYLCEDFADGQGVPTVTFDTVHNKCARYLDLCCPVDKIIKMPVTASPIEKKTPEDCVCKPYYMCEDFADGQAVHVGSFDTVHNKCEKYLDLCCPMDKILKEPKY